MDHSIFPIKPVDSLGVFVNMELQEASYHSLIKAGTWDEIYLLPLV